MGSLRSSALCAALLLAALLPSLAGPPAATAEESCLRLGLDEWPPYEFTRDGRVQGMATEIVLNVVARMGRCVRSVTSYPWNRGLDMLRDGRLDMLFSADYRPEREDWGIYPDEALVDSAWVIYVRADRPDLSRARSLDDLRDIPGLKIGTVRGFSYPQPVLDLFVQKPALREGAGEVVTDELNFRRIAAGRIDALICDRYNGAWLARELGVTDAVRLLPVPVAPSRLYPLFSRRSMPPEFVTRFGKELRAFKAEEKYRHILEHWLTGKP